MNLFETITFTLREFGRIFSKLEVALLSIIFISIVILGLTQIGLRNLADSSLHWSDAAMRAGVLWIAMIASMIAAGESKHIQIDLLSRLIKPFWALWIGRAMLLMAALVCVAMTIACWPIVEMELEYPEAAFLNVPRWLVLSIIPVGFAIMSYRFIRSALAFDPDKKPSA